MKNLCLVIAVLFLRLTALLIPLAIFAPVNIAHSFNLPTPADISQVDTRKGTFLAATRNMTDPRFKESVIFLFKSDTHSSMGLIINKPSTLTLSGVLPSIKLPKGTYDTIYYGGPVDGKQLFTLVKSKTPVEGATRLTSDLHICSDHNSAIRALIAQEGRNVRLYLGYAGWGPKQLDMEIQRGDWVVADIEINDIFDKTPADMWPSIMKKEKNDNNEKWIKLQKDEKTIAFLDSAIDEDS